MKLFIDRMRPFADNKKLKGKKGVIVVPSEEGLKACEPLIEMFRLIFAHLGMEFAGRVLATAYEAGEIRGNQEELKKAYEFGISL